MGRRAQQGGCCCPARRWAVQRAGRVPVGWTWSHCWSFWSLLPGVQPGVHQERAQTLPTHSCVCQHLCQGKGVLRPHIPVPALDSARLLCQAHHHCFSSHQKGGLGTGTVRLLAAICKTWFPHSQEFSDRCNVSQCKILTDLVIFRGFKAYNFFNALPLAAEAASCYGKYCSEIRLKQSLPWRSYSRI